MLAPQNGILPQEKFVKFEICSESMERVFLDLDLLTHRRKVLLFRVKRSGRTFFYRTVRVPPGPLTLVGELRKDLKLLKMVGFQSRPFEAKYFKDLKTDWLHYQDTPGYCPVACLRQADQESHSEDFHIRHLEHVASFHLK